MNVIPVLDVLHGQVVRGVGGDRENYRPIVSQITTSSNPLEVARTLRKDFGFQRFYLADLDGILSQNPNLKLYNDLISDHFHLMIEAGIRNLDDAQRIHRVAKHAGIIVGLETCRSPQDLRKIASQGFNVTFSLDLISSQPNLSSESRGWSNDPIEIVGEVVDAKVDSILVLDLADVGMGTGGGTDGLCQKILCEFPAVQLISGGGIRDRDDLLRLSRLGIDSVLVASALHDGKLRREDMMSL